MVKFWAVFLGNSQLIDLFRDKLAKFASDRVHSLALMRQEHQRHTKILQSLGVCNRNFGAWL